MRNKYKPLSLVFALFMILCLLVSCAAPSAEPPSSEPPSGETPSKEIPPFIAGMNSAEPPSHDDDTPFTGDWTAGALIAPAAGQLVPAGPIAVRWYHNAGDVERYDVYLGDTLTASVAPPYDNAVECEIYSTEVSAHTVRIEALLSSGETLSTNWREFYVSKKGIGFFNDLSNMEDMNLSWYYNWSPVPSTANAVSGLDFIPMFWSGRCDPNRIADYKTVLGCNEPDHTGQVNKPAATVARDWWPSFAESGKRLGSPAVAWQYGNEQGQWLYDFMELIKLSDGTYPVDFIAVHWYNWPTIYEDFKQLLADIWERYQKPIWITEFACAHWPSHQDNHQDWGYSQAQVEEFMEQALDWLDQTAYIERYAWFSFGDPDGKPYGEDAGNYSALTDRKTGRLTNLGELYREKGNPDGYDPDGPAADIEYVKGE